MVRRRQRSTRAAFDVVDGVQVLTSVLARLHDSYGAGDRFAPWRAYALCRAGRQPIPDWVLEYLERVAARIGEMRPGGRTPQPDPARFASLVLEALDLKAPGRSGRGTAYTRAAKALRDRWLAFEVDIETQTGKQVKHAARDVAERHRVSLSTVERARATLRKSPTS